MTQQLRHIAFIMDGNGRWATARKHARGFGHQKGVDALVRVLDACFDRGVEVVTVYAFSTENWSRPKSEINKIFRILRDYLKDAADKLCERHARLVIAGDETALPADLQHAIRDVRDRTEAFTERAFCLALNYGGRAEIVRAVNRLLAARCTEVTEEEFSRALYTAGLPEPELIVRTGGKQRLSNFLLYQSAYSELYFTDILWPDFDERALDDAIDWYQGVTRNFGAVTDAEEKK